MKQKILIISLIGTISCFSQNFTLDENSGILPVQRNWDEIAFEDIDGDGFIDLFTGGAAPNFVTVGRMYKNDGTGKFTLDDDETFIKKREGGVAFGDVNGDGFPDMVVSGGYGSPGGGLTQLYLNDGNGNFTLDYNASFVGTREGDIRMFDFDNDGDLDILVTGMMGSYAMHLYENDGTGAFTLIEQTGLEQYGLGHAYVIIADLDNDGFLDIATNGKTSVSGGSYKTRIFRNNGDRTFSLMVQPAFDYIAAGAIAIGDVDNNGTLDLVFSGQGPASDDNPYGFGSGLFLNDGNANFTLAENTNFIGHRDFPTIALADFDNDGSLDLITMGRITMDPATLATYLYLNDGEGNFTLVEDTPFTGHSFGKVTVADVNNDGTMDVLITGTGDGPGNSAVAKLYLNNVGGLNIEKTEIQTFKIYPNPATSYMTLEFDFPITEYTGIIYNLLGQRVLSFSSSHNMNNTIDIGKLKQGTYFLQLTNEGRVYTKAFIKN